MDPAAADGARPFALGAAIYVLLFLASLAGTWLLVRGRSDAAEDR